MAIKIPIITELQDEGIKKAKREFDKFKGAVAGAEGTMGKFKAGSKAIFDGIQANAATFATAAAGAFVTFAAKGVTAFRDLALQADKFAGATGLAVDEASRLIDVVEGLGIEATTVETGIGRMNKTIGTSPELFKELGIQVKYAEDGTLDANETFLNLIDRLNNIKDPAEKARIAAQLLGKGWQGMANLISMGSEDLRKSLASVSDARTISPEEAAKARKFRDTMDDLKDVVFDLSLTLGQVLVPVLTKTAEILKSISKSDFFDGVAAGFDKLVSPVTWTFDQADKLGKELHTTGDLLWYSFFGDPRYKGPPVHVEAMEASRKEAAMFREELRQFRRPDVSDPFEELRKASEKLRIELQNVADKWDFLTGKLDQTVALDNAEQQLIDLEAAAAKAFGSGSAEDLAAYNQQAANFAGLLATIAESMGNISSREILLKFETKGPKAAVDLAKWLASGAELTGLSAADLLTQAGIPTTVGARAMGGTVSAGRTYVVGERGPELLTVGAGGGHVTPMGAGGPVNITVNMPAGSNGDDVVRALQSYNRTSGPIPVNVRPN